MTSAVKRAFKFRFYPTPCQAEQLARTFGCVRLVYNKALDARMEAYRCRGEHLGYSATSSMLTAWKRLDELAFLNEVSSVPLQQALRHLNTAYANFFAKRARYPRFKSRKKSRATAEYTRSAFRYQDGLLTLAKQNEPLAVVWSRPLPEGAKPSTVTVSRDRAGRWFVSILVEDHPIMAAAPVGAAVGIDAGVETLVTLSTGEKIGNPRQEKRERAALARAQRGLSRKHKGSNNREKARVRVARVHARITDRRRDLLHQLSTRLVRENQTLVIEDLNVAGMVRNRYLARAISDAAWREFRSMVEYKAAWYRRTLVVVDRWFPSSKLCSSCGARRAAMPLEIRSWTCPCGTVHDRDVNAARNILAAGLAVTACGADVRHSGAFLGVRSAMKQEAQPVTAGTPAF